MRIQKNSKTIVCCFMACVAGSLFFSMSNQAEAQVTYKITGIFDDTGFGSPLVASGETFTAIFEIDDSVVDANPSDPLRGEYSGAIISSSFTFSGGFTSMVDFSGGVVTVLPDNGGGGIILQSAGGEGALILFSSETLASDALLNSEQEITGDTPESLWLLTEPNGGGQLHSFSGVELGHPMVLSITAAQAPMLGDVNLSGTVDFLDISPFIGVLTGASFQTEADCDENGMVDFSDISPFIAILAAG